MIKIGRLKLNNFKSFDNGCEFDFTNKSLVVFDGPNGYGKTTIFDALELSLVKKITRYIDVDSKVKRSDLINSGDSKTNIFLELLDQNSTGLVVVINYEGSKYNKVEDVFSKIQYSYYAGWEDALSGMNEIKKIPDFIFDNKVENLFNIFNYIQQEETVNFLKYDEKTRHTKINSLFGTSENSEILKKIDRFIDFLETEKNEVIKTITSKESERDLLFSSNNIDFDIDELEINKENFDKNDILEKINSFEKVNTIIGSEVKYKNSLHYYSIKSLLSNGVTLEDFFSYYKYSLEDFEKGKKRYKSLLKKISWLDQLTKFKYASVDLSVFLKDMEKSDIYFIKNIYNNNIDLINDFFNQKSGLDYFSNELEEFRRKRELFLKSYVHTDKVFLDNCSCPICGQNYETIDQFNTILADFSFHLNSLGSDKNYYFNKILNKVNEKVVSLVVNRVDYFIGRYGFLNDVLYDHMLYNYDLDKLKIIHEILYNAINLNFNFENGNPTVFLDFINSLDLYQREDFIRYESALAKVDIEFVHDRFIDGGFYLVDEYYVSNRISKYKAILNSINTSLYSDLNKVVNLNKVLVSKIDDKIVEVRKLRFNYNKSIKEYEANLVSNIQIPFYVYTSKILQTRKNGSGLFIKLSENQNMNNFIKFCVSKDDDNDAWNRLSSGQLSGLVIALTLSMNKAFPNKLKFLLIDDPVHYMDDINMASLIQLLMYDFNDYQFIFSTHDNKVSSYFKRKYHDYGLEASTFNLKEIKLKNIS